ncbi:MAG: NUDIX hydrolase [Marinifilum sp.]|jgi:8-oxo-dGTP diphosphatase|nr:NUDIX hydrolase [Marinifilum sp.]
MFTYQYPRPALTVDCAVFCTCKDKNYVLLIERANDPFKNKWAFPGGFVDMDEDIESAAYRELMEETGFENVTLAQFKTYGAVNRDPRGRTVSVVYLGQIISDELPQVKGDDDALKAQWLEIQDLPALAFDHDQIIQDLKEYLELL